ncbi:MAG: 7-carboxy-7-deazaguanine synthase QueE [Candidatus Margulisiibacteriota bacterium]
MSMIRVSEIFYSVQGEGVTVGVPAIFIRLQGCNLDCGSRGGAWVCDTEAVWKRGEKRLISELAETIQVDFNEALRNGAHVVITGGEPLLQQDAVIELLHQFNNKWPIEIETNGTILPHDPLKKRINYWNVSPKLSNSGEAFDKRVQPSLDWFSEQPNAIFKFVVNNENDINEIESSFKWVKQLPIRQKFLMPAADNRIELHQKYESIISLAKSNGYSLSQRLHLTVWDQKTGI